MDLDQIKALIAQSRFKEAALILDDLLAQDSMDDELWYFRGVVSLKMRNYDAAQECFDRALLLGKKSRYYQIRGMAYFEMFDLEDAADSFREALLIEPQDVTTNFFLSICYLFLDDARADEHIKRARSSDAKKTRQLLLNFYTLFLKDDPRMSDAIKKKIEEKIRGI